MQLFGKPSLAVLLENEKKTLEDIFGYDSFRIEAHHKDEAKLHTDLLEIIFGRDSRDGDISAVIGLRESVAKLDWEDGTFQWSKFLGEKDRPKDRDRNGKVVAGAQDQVKGELKLICRLVKEIFSDTQRTRDAVHWLDGYREAYTNWAEGDWD
ncbi:hypothetical protein [Sphingorhabdus sp. Alg231-15]|uniref:hypothetical protein n=1 Tax=Sphingorhabdus sp. Alg231-15 TaxID=1922222 RepID=UPI000D55B8A9